jgi:tRNA threonylcarbamoyladenosine biosynthesis protein TsaB
MICLALEFSSPRRSVAIGQDGRVIAETGQSSGRWTPVFALVDEALSIAGIPRGSIEAIAVGLGPGSYTGIRSAIAIAQGWQLATGVSLQGLGSMEIAAHQARRQGLRGRIAVVIDAQRREFHVGEFDVTGEGIASVGELRILDRSAVDHLAQSGCRLVGPEVKSQGFVATTVLPTAGALIERAANSQSFQQGEDMTPIYLRPPAFVKAAIPRFAAAARAEPAAS